MVDNKNIKELLKSYEDNLMEAIIIISHLLNVDKSYIYAHMDEEIDIDVEKEFINMMSKIKDDYPIQYLLNEKDFMSLNLHVEEGVLIPRSDTEVLVEYLIDYIGDEDLNILEIGYGSGAIAISIAKYCKNSKVMGIDISDKAYKVANINKDKFSLDNVEFIKGDLFNPLKDEIFDIIVSNPPYIKNRIIEDLDRNVKDYEPIIALDGGEDGLDFYRKITEESPNFLEEDGLLIYEVGYDQGELVSEILEDNGFENIQRLKDIQEYERVVLGFKG